MRRLAIVLLVLLVGCVEEEPVADQGPEARLASERAICEESGGTFGTRPGGLLSVCTTFTSDANQRCVSNADCEGVCLARAQACAPVIPLFGCNEQLVSPGRVATICVD